MSGQREEARMVDFTSWTDREVLSHLWENYGDLDVGSPEQDLVERLLSDVEGGHVALEKRREAFALVARANRKHTGAVAWIQIEPESDLMYLFVSKQARGTGVGPRILREVKEKYMEDRAMILVCAGEDRKRFFERAGFVVQGLTYEGLYYMECPPIQQPQ